MSVPEKIKYLIIGNSAGGIGAAEAIREVDKKGTINVISDEPYPAYSRPLISDYLAGDYTVEKMLYRPVDFYEKNSIKTILGDKVIQLDTEKHTVKLESIKPLTYQKLLLATGGSPIIPRIEGNGLQGVFTFNKLDDARSIDEFLNRYTKKIRAVVIGGGLIGASVTEALLKREVKVTIVEMKDRILNTILDEETSAMEAEALVECGVEIITDHTAVSINSYFPGEVSGISLDDGRSIPCDMVVIAVGVQPRLDFIKNSGIKVNRGVIVDRQMQTSVADVYACGDVAEAFDFIYRENRLTPIWPNAYAGGRTAGRNMAGIPDKYPGGTAMNAVKYFGVKIVSAGLVVPPDESYETLREVHDHIYRKIILRDGKLAGMVFAGDIEKSGIVYNLMKDGTDVSSFKEAIISDDFGLTSLPDDIRQAKLATPPDKYISVVTSIEEPEEIVVEE
ncbi:MAG TPA: NAD(P)/FAD-dependent oxidoreductase [Dehalococcoidia bacterium]|nr:NAD(P)/FAD-dependent oxidoreductase [Dehalococcoidia bacterium]